MFILCSVCSEMFEAFKRNRSSAFRKKFKRSKCCCREHFNSHEKSVLKTWQQRDGSKKWEKSKYYTIATVCWTWNCYWSIECNLLNWRKLFCAIKTSFWWRFPKFSFLSIWNCVNSHHFDFFFQELADIKASGLKSFRDIEVDDRNILIWSGLICPVSWNLESSLCPISCTG